jgi:hypothetical protein
MFKKLSLSEATIVRVALSCYQSTLGDMIANPTPTSDQPKVQAERMVSLGTEYNQTTALLATADAVVAAGQLKAKQRVEKKASKTANVAA